MSIAGLIIDGVVVLLLGVTAFYCARLNGRLKALHNGQDGLKDLVAGLDRATERAQMSVSELKTLGASAAGDLKKEREAADKLLEELKLMIGSADRVANRLAEPRPQGAEPRLSATRDTPPSGDIFQALRQAR